MFNRGGTLSEVFQVWAGLDEEARAPHEQPDRHQQPGQEASKEVNA
jgi:hypothetical protein